MVATPQLPVPEPRRLPTVRVQALPDLLVLMKAMVAVPLRRPADTAPPVPRPPAVAVHTHRLPTIAEATVGPLIADPIRAVVLQAVAAVPTLPVAVLLEEVLTPPAEVHLLVVAVVAAPIPLVAVRLEVEVATLLAAARLVEAAATRPAGLLAVAPVLHAAALEVVLQADAEEADRPCLQAHLSTLV